jgi:hypothetical protein
MSTIHEVRKRKVSRCHSSEEFGLADGIEGKCPVAGEYYSVGWVGVERSADGSVDVIDCLGWRPPDAEGQVMVLRRGQSLAEDGRQGGEAQM